MKYFRYEIELNEDLKTCYIEKADGQIPRLTSILKFADKYEFNCFTEIQLDFEDFETAGNIEFEPFESYLICKMIGDNSNIVEWMRVCTVMSVGDVEITILGSFVPRFVGKKSSTYKFHKIFDVDDNRFFRMKQLTVCD